MLTLLTIAGLLVLVHLVWGTCYNVRQVVCKTCEEIAEYTRQNMGQVGLLLLTSILVTFVIEPGGIYLLAHKYHLGSWPPPYMVMTGILLSWFDAISAFSGVGRRDPSSIPYGLWSVFWIKSVFMAAPSVYLCYQLWRLSQL
jgi:hypothetical protein